MKRAFVISDIHGMIEQLEELLGFWNREDQLIILGDMIDRGKNSLKVVKRIMELSKDYPIVLIKGNHDQMLLDYIENPSNFERYYRNGAETTVASFCQTEDVLKLDHEQRVNQMKEKCKEEIEFLKTGRLYYLFNKVLFTHAGFNSEKQNWQETSEDEFIWIRDHFEKENKSGYINVFGHTPTRYIHKSISDAIWISEDQTYIGIDGGCAYGGQLNGIIIDEKGHIVDTYAIKNDEKNTSN